MPIPIIEIGRFNELEVLKKTEQGLYLGDAVEEILLPNKYIPEGIEIGDRIRVFIYTDSEDRLIATTLTPKIQVGEFAYLQVKEVAKVGAFLDWGLEKDLLVPFKEQLQKMEAGQYYLVHMYLDEVTDRLVASSHLNKFLETKNIDLQEGQEVQVLVGPETEIGYTVIIENRYRGLIYKNQVFRKVHPGDRTSAYIKQVRPDQKIDLTLEPTGHLTIEPNAKRILERLQTEGGFLPVHDKTDPEKVKHLFNMSKKNFKKAIGLLYKQRLILITAKGIRLIK